MVREGFIQKKSLRRDLKGMRFEVRAVQGTKTWLVYSPKHQRGQCSWNTVSDGESEWLGTGSQKGGAGQGGPGKDCAEIGLYFKSVLGSHWMVLSRKVILSAFGF